MSSASSRTRAFRNALLMAVGLTVGAVSVPQRVSAAGEIVTDVAPPAPRLEHAPPHRDGYVWTGGHWEWNGRFYTWVSGSFIVERRNAHWIADHWEQMGAQWRYIPGHWEH